MNDKTYPILTLCVDDILVAVGEKDEATAEKVRNMSEEAMAYWARKVGEAMYDGDVFYSFMKRIVDEVKTN